MGCVDRMRRKKIMGGNQRKGRSEGDGTNPTRIGHPPSRLAGTVIHVGVKKFTYILYVVFIIGIIYAPWIIR